MPSTSFPFSRFMAASAWFLPPMVTKQTLSRTMVIFSTTPKAPKMNSTPRSLNSLGRPHTDNLAALILGGACGRPERGGLVSWLMFRFSRGARIQTHLYNGISGFSRRGEALRPRGPCDNNPLLPLETLLVFGLPWKRGLPPLRVSPGREGASNS